VARATTSTGWLGSRLLFPDAVAGSGARPEQICLLAPAGASDLCERAVATDPGGRTLSNPAASPDGCALVSVAEPFVAGGKRFAGSIALFDPATGAFVRDLTSGQPDRGPAFSPDGRQVAFTRDNRLYIVKLAGGAPKLVRRGVSDPTWGAG
jgi:Tol biopolymer transport system component